MKTYKYLDLMKSSKIDNSEKKHIKLAIVSNVSTQHLAVALKGQAYYDSINLEIFDAPYNQIDAQILDKNSEVFSFDPSFILINISSQKLYNDFLQCSKKESFAQDIINKIVKYWEHIETFSSSKIVQYNFAYYNDYIFGNYSLKQEQSFAYQIQKLNYLLSEYALKNKNVFLVDINMIQSSMGRGKFFDDKMYYSSKLAFSLEALPVIAKQTLDCIKATLGNVKKCIILDLDNTLWGGVIGDDGLEHIQLGDLGVGQAYVAFQSWLKQLKERGVILCVCSKNNKETALLPFKKHPDMVLKEQDISVFVANWEDKASNIKYIQQVLNIGMDSIVFVDDNEFERNQVQSQIKDISVPSLPDDPALFIKTLQEYNYFETASFSSEDKQRTQKYIQEAKRKELQTNYLDYSDFLKSLNMIASVEPFNEFNAPRVAQLSQRSNQFNLRTIRYSEQEILSLQNNLNYLTRCYFLKDSLGEYGLIGVVIMNKQENSLFIDTLLMSCRVLKRGMEEFIFNDIVKIAKENGYKKIIGEYIPTEKNNMVKDLYIKMGFEKVKENIFKLDVEKYINQKTEVKEI